jgi:predicted lipoprotein with Yx(FWY)xxD motif
MVALTASAVAAVALARSKHPALQLRQTRLGKILVNSRGYTVYTFSRDRRNVDECARIRNCLSVWPVVAPGRPLAGPGVKASLIRTITVRRGVRQLTYAGHPLYTYSGDAHPAQTTYVNVRQFGGRWPALNAAGREVR